RDLTIEPEIWWLPHDRQVAVALKSYIALLALSARSPAPADTKKGFAALPERAQAAVINYAASAGKASGSVPESASPSALVKALTKEPDAPFPKQQRVELTISGAVNSASARDRFDYLAAYLSIPPLTGRLNARVSLERELLRHFAKLYYARPVDERSD